MASKASTIYVLTTYKIWKKDIHYTPQLQLFALTLHIFSGQLLFTSGAGGHQLRKIMCKQLKLCYTPATTLLEDVETERKSKERKFFLPKKKTKKSTKNMGFMCPFNAASAG